MGRGLHCIPAWQHVNTCNRILNKELYDIIELLSTVRYNTTHTHTHTHTRARAHTTICSTPTPPFFCFRILGLLSSFGLVSNIPHTHTSMLNAHPTIFCFIIFDLLSSFGFVSNIPQTHHDALRPPHHFSFPSFGFVIEFWIRSEHSTHPPRCSTTAP